MGALKSVLLGLFIGIIFIITIGVSVAFFYEDEVTRYFIEDLNQSISVKIEVEKTDFSVLRKFPNASVEFKNLVAFTPEGFTPEIFKTNTDTLFYGKRVFIEFNIIDLLSQNFTIKNIHFDEARINLFIDEQGIENYIFWENEQNDTTGKFNLELKKVKLTNTHLVYYNQQEQIFINTRIDKAILKGNFSEKNYNLDLQANQRIKIFKLNENYLIQNKNIDISILLDVTEKKIEFQKGNIAIETLKLDVNGKIQKEESPVLDLFITANNQPVKSVFNVIPHVFRKDISFIDMPEGLISFNAQIKGNLSKIKVPKITAGFEIKNAQINYPDKEILIHISDLRGRYLSNDVTKPELSIIEIKQFNASLQESSIEGKFEIRDFAEPLLMLNISSEIDFNKINKIFTVDTLETIEGKGNLLAEYKGTLKELKEIKFKDLFTREYNLKLNIKDGKFKMKGRPLVLEEVNGNILINKDVYADSLSFKISDSDFFIRGEALNVYNYFNLGEPVNVKAEINSDLINLNQLSSFFSAEKSNTTNPSYQFPDKLSLVLKLKVNQFSVGKFEATNVQGRLNYKPRMFSLNEISFHSMDGNAKIGGVIVQNYKSDFLVKSQSKLTGININKLFYSFNNFGQDFLPEKNIDGSISGDVFFSSDFSEKLIINKKSVIAESDITISNGALIGFEPMKSLSKYIDVNELENIKFSTLHNQISIKNEQVYIPRMDIQSSALNLSVSGTHHFNNTFEYHFKVLLSDVLAKKAKKKAREQGEFDNVEDDGFGKTQLFLKIKGTPDDYKITYDRKQARENRKEEYNTEKKELKKLLNSEFGWYNSDSTIKTNTPKEKNFDIEWEEKKNDTESGKKGIKTDSKDKFEIEWDEDSTDNSNKEE